MEDAHIAEYNIAPDVHIFGVFDGHGGTISTFTILFSLKLSVCDDT